MLKFKTGPPATRLHGFVMPIQRLSVEGEAGEPTWTEPDKDGEYVYWEDVAQLMVDVSGLIARIELANDLHAVFTIKDAAEFEKVKAGLKEVFKA
jgi:hypothetical protein